jgi:hypothetical protein
LLFLGWWLLPLKRQICVAFLIWALLNLFGGGILSVLPFPFWPFHPEQTAFHYLMHVQYTLTQIPLVVILLQQARLTFFEMAGQETSRSGSRTCYAGDLLSDDDYQAGVAQAMKKKKS